MKTKGLIPHYRDAALPLSRIDVARFLSELNGERANLNGVEQRRLEWIMAEYAREIKRVGRAAADGEIPWNLYSYEDSTFSMTIDPVVEGIVTSNLGKGNRTRRGFGILSRGYSTAGFSYHLKYIDYRETGPLADPARTDSPEPGVVVSKPGFHSFEFDNLSATVGFENSWLGVSFGKDVNKWGLGAEGPMILSDRAPGYPHIRLRFRIGDWLEYTYMHSWLFSGILDSLQSYPTSAGTFRSVYRSKYLVSQMLQVRVARGVDASLGSSVVYSDRGLDPLYLIPVSFLRGAEHYNDSQDNAQIFGTIELNVVPDVSFSGTFFVDELQAESVIPPRDLTYYGGFQAGVSAVNVFLPYLDLLVDYTQIRPWTYAHGIPSANYTSHGYDLGDWLGQNADRILLKASWSPTETLEATGFVERIRKGIPLEGGEVYAGPVNAYLRGGYKRRESLGLSVCFMPIHRVSILGTIQHNSWSIVGDAAFIEPPGTGVPSGTVVSLDVRWNSW